MIKTLSAALMLSLASLGAAQACEDPVALDQAQVRELITTVRSDKADPLDQIFAFETLMCAKRHAVRDYAARTALQSPNKTLQATIMFELFMAKEGALMEFIAEEGMPKEVYAYIKERPSVFFRFDGKSREASCVTTYGKACHEDGASFFMEISGTRVALRHNDEYVGTFALKGTELVGTVSGSHVSWERKSLGALPAKIRLID
ncbi:MAG: hypothetical protein MRY63_04565 [Neomegalonema sp.]|nr:hypothetical protein [Neomegalonema sp.]